MVTLNATNLDNRIIQIDFNSVADSCPFCKKGINPIILTAFVDCQEANISRGTKAWVIFRCPINNCRNIFMGVYRNNGNRFYGPSPVYPVFSETKVFSEIINNISPIFIKIYNQSFFAEQQKYSLIAGPGYRKALEFLIKDYAIRISEDDQKDDILNKYLGKVIEDYIDDRRIKSVAKRAAWLGNDETHYLRKWEDKDLTELKTLIELSVRWIEMVELTEGYEQDMPD